MNYLCLGFSVNDRKNYLSLRTKNGLFHIEVEPVTNSKLEVKISDENLNHLRIFLNEMINQKERSLNENS